MEIGMHVNYILSEYSENAGETRPAIILHQRPSGAVHLLVLVEPDDFSPTQVLEGRIASAELEEGVLIRHIHGRVVEAPEEGSLAFYVNGVEQGVDLGTWHTPKN